MVSKKRDVKLDYLRGFAMIQVVLIHILYWMHFFDDGFPSLAKSFLLFEMPVLFFVTGAANGMATIKSYKSFCIKRVKGMLVPYYVYVVFCILLTLQYNYLFGEFTLTNLGDMIISWLIPIKTPLTSVLYLPLASWFVLTYINNMILFPVVRAATSKYGMKTLYGLIVLLLLYEAVCSGIDFEALSEVLFVDCVAIQDVIQKSLFYLIFLCLGLFYPKIRERNIHHTRLAFTLLLVSVICMVICGLLPGQTLDMQRNKFPPNHIFLFFCFAALCVIYLSAPAVKKIFRHLGKLSGVLKKIILLFSRQSIYIFLYQSFCFYVTYWLFSKFSLKNELQNESLRFIVFIATVYPMIMLTAIVIEKLLCCVHGVKKRLIRALNDYKKD